MYVVKFKVQIFAGLHRYCLNFSDIKSPIFLNSNCITKYKRKIGVKKLIQHLPHHCHWVS